MRDRLGASGRGEYTNCQVMEMVTVDRGRRRKQLLSRCAEKAYARSRKKTTIETLHGTHAHGRFKINGFRFVLFLLLLVLLLFHSLLHTFSLRTTQGKSSNIENPRKDPRRTLFFFFLSTTGAVLSRVSVFA